jgi:transposase
MLSLNPINCWKPLRAFSATTWEVIPSVNAKKEKDWAISSRISEKSEKGPTTRISSLTLKAMAKVPRTWGACEIGVMGDITPVMVKRKLFATSEELKAKYCELKSVVKVAKFYGVSKKTILNWMNKFEVERDQSPSLERMNELFIQKVKEGKSTREIAEELELDDTTIRKWAASLGYRLDTFHKGFIITHNGYKLIKAKDHPFADSKGYVREHRLVMEEKLGRFLTPDEIVHHIDENKLNNAPENLEVMSKAEHCRHHKPQVKI